MLKMKALKNGKFTGAMKKTEQTAKNLLEYINHLETTAKVRRHPMSSIVAFLGFFMFLGGLTAFLMQD